MLKHRIITGLALLLLILGFIFYSSDTIWFGFVALLVLLVSMEYLNFFPLSTLYKYLYLIITISIGFLVYQFQFSSVLKYKNYLYFIPFIFWIVFVPLLFYFKFKINSKFLIFIIGLILFLPFWYFMYKFRHIEIFNIHFTSVTLLITMGFVWIADIGAYFSGKALGKHKLAINISPGKTIEGYIGGMIFVYLYFFILHWMNLFRYNLITWNLFVVLVLIFFLVHISVLGDLFESFLKRQANVKDSGKILPGHGGVFDRIDSLVAVFGVLPFTFFLISLI